MLLNICIHYIPSGMLIWLKATEIASNDPAVVKVVALEEDDEIQVPHAPNTAK